MEINYKMDRYRRSAERHIYEQKLAPCGIRFSQHMFINHICSSPGLTQDKLPGLVYINKSNVTRILKTLEEEGFVRREVNPDDMRTVRLYPTERAMEIFPMVMEQRELCEELMMEGFSEEEKEMLISLLMRVTKNIRKQLPDAWEKTGRKSSFPPPFLFRRSCARLLSGHFPGIAAEARSSYPAWSARSAARAFSCSTNSGLARVRKFSLESLPLSAASSLSTLPSSLSRRASSA